MIKSILSPLFAALLPGSCLLCGTVCSDTLLCPGCEADLPARLDPQHCCPCCAAPVWQDVDGHPVSCLNCRGNPPAFQRTIAAFPYAFPLDTLVQQLKYQHQLAVADWLGLHLVDQIAHQWPEADFDAIIPLPLHGSRLCWRGFNQAMQLAKVISHFTGWPLYPELCERRLPTLPQASLNRAERLTNVRAAFHCPVPLDNARLLLVDDVMTTGSTLNACAEALHLAGASSVSIAVVARAQGH